MKAIIKYNNEDGDSEATIRVEDGGIATIHHNGEHFITEYYQDRCFEEKPNWCILSEGKMNCKDWDKTKEKIDAEMIKDALAWLVVCSKVEFEIIENYLFETKLTYKRN